MKFSVSLLIFLMTAIGCSHQKTKEVSLEDASRIDRELVRETVVFEPGTKEGATVPDVSAPRLRAIKVKEHIEGNRLIEAHREWILEGDMMLLGIPKSQRKVK